MALLRHDRLSSNEFVITQDLIANKLGLRREVVSLQAARPQDAGLIDYSRGNILIVDRAGLLGPAVTLAVRPPKRLFRLVLESHN